MDTEIGATLVWIGLGLWALGWAAWLISLAVAKWLGPYFDLSNRRYMTRNPRRR